MQGGFPVPDVLIMVTAGGQLFRIGALDEDIEQGENEDRDADITVHVEKS